MKRVTQAEFLERARHQHGTKYNYSLTIYKGGKSGVVISCPVHGPFIQIAANHTLGQGCPACAGKTGAEHGLSSFLLQSRATHGTKYDYSKVNYSGLEKKVSISCPEHGAFNQVARSHMRGSSCPKCALEATAVINRKRRKYTVASWKAEACKRHGGRYDYSRVFVLPIATSAIEILCLEHGAFSQRAHLHLFGQGCPFCKAAGARERERLLWIAQAQGKVCSLYFIRLFNDDEEFFKVGVTVKTVKKRYCSAKSAGGYAYEVLALHQSLSATAVYDWEQSILETFAYLRYKPKKSFAGSTECFSSADEILAIFPL